MVTMRKAATREARKRALMTAFSRVSLSESRMGRS